MATPLQPIPHGNSASIVVEIAFPNNFNDVGGALVWTDVTRRIRWTTDGGITFKRGRDDEYQQVVPGTFQIMFNNLDRAFDPTFTGSPFYPNVDAARPIRITCYWAGTSYIQFVGLVDEWVPRWTPGGDAICTASGMERLGALTYTKNVYLGDVATTAQARLANMVTNAGYPASEQSFAAGTWPLQAQTYNNMDTLTACQQITNGQVQVFFTSRTGIFTSAGMFDTIATAPTPFGDKGIGVEIPFQHIDVANGGAYIYTVVIMQPAAPTGGTQQPPATASVSSTKRSRYGYRPLAMDIAATTTANAQAAASSLANGVNIRDKTRLKSMVLKPMRDPTNAWPVVLAADFGTRVSAGYLPPGGGPRFEQLGIVRSIQMDIKRDWVVTWMLSPI